MRPLVRRFADKGSIVSNETLNFNIEEYKALRVELDNLQKQSYLMENFFIVGLATVIGFSVKQLVIPADVWWAIFWLTVVAMIRKAAIRGRVNSIGDYIRSIESELSTNGILGWETTLNDNKFVIRLGKSAILFWFAACGLTYWIASKGGLIS